MITNQECFDWIADDFCHLRCPTCGCDNTHHASVQVFGRDQEDADSGLHVVVNGEMLSIDRDISGNPSSRRDGITIEFWCEHGCPNFYMAIAQHKGATEIGLAVAHEPPALTTVPGSA